MELQLIDSSGFTVQGGQPQSSPNTFNEPLTTSPAQPRDLPPPEFFSEQLDRIREAGLAASANMMAASTMSTPLGGGDVGAIDFKGLGLGRYGRPAVTLDGQAIRPLASPLPQYPLAARMQGRSGVVELAVRINGHGIPLTATVTQSSGYEDFDRVACNTVRRFWRFPARLRHGSADEPPVRVTIHFDLQQI